MSFQKTSELEACSAALKKLSIRWAEARSSPETANNQVKSKNGQKASLGQCSGSMLDADDELAELSGLIEVLKSLSGSFEATHFWLNHMEEASQNAVQLASNMMEP